MVGLASIGQLHLFDLVYLIWKPLALCGTWSTANCVVGSCEQPRLSARTKLFSRSDASSQDPVYSILLFCSGTLDKVPPSHIIYKRHQLLDFRLLQLLIGRDSVTGRKAAANAGKSFAGIQILLLFTWRICARPSCATTYTINLFSRDLYACGTFHLSSTFAHGHHNCRVTRSSTGTSFNSRNLLLDSRYLQATASIDAVVCSSQSLSIVATGHYSSHTNGCHHQLLLVAAQ